MSYLVLARKYRPGNFAQMVGQEHVVQALRNALDSERLHHAYLFTGTRGVGKTTVSRVLAKSLNCQGTDGQGGITATPCGVCPACRAIDAGHFVDYTELDAASNRGVDEVQALLEQAVYKPVQGRFKVFMIDEVHMLTHTAFNAMLKTLEEPPPYLKFVLATTDPQKVPVTVLSRCLQFNLRPIAPDTITEHLQRVLQAEKVPADAPALRLIARAARGSMRDALSLCDQAIAFGSGHLQEATVRQMLGSVDRPYVLGLIEALALGDGKTVVETADILRKQGLSAAHTLEEMSLVLQRMAVLQLAPEARTEDSDPEATECLRLAQLMPPDETQLLYSLCLHGRSDLDLAPDEYAALSMALLRLLAFKPQTTERQVETKTPPQARPASLPAPAASTPARPPGAYVPVRQANGAAPLSEPARPSAVPAQGEPLAVRVQGHTRLEAAPDRAAFTPSKEGDFWSATVQKLLAQEAVVALTRELALQSQLVARDTDQWLLRVESELLQQKSSRDRLAAALAGIGHAVHLVVEIGRVTDSPALRNTAALAERQLAAEKAVFSDPQVQAMMRDFGAKIVPGSIKSLPSAEGSAKLA